MSQTLFGIEGAAPAGETSVATLSPLSAPEAERRAELETLVQAGLQTWLAVGNALADIRDEKLYRSSHWTFEEYCLQTFDFRANYAGRLMRAGRVVSELQATLPLGAVLPANEAQAREVEAAPEERRTEVWQTAVETAPEGKVTARHVVATREGLLEEIPQRFLPALQGVEPSEREAVYQEALELAGEEPVTLEHVRAAAAAAAAIPRGVPLTERPLTDRPKLMAAGHSDEFQTPPEALAYLLPYLPPASTSVPGGTLTVWECANGQGKLAAQLREAGYRVLESDFRTGQDFLSWEPGEPYHLIVTNPPFRLKKKFLERAYALGKPFAFLLPLNALVDGRQDLHRSHDPELIVLPERIACKTPTGREGADSSPWQALAWVTHGLGVGQGMSFANRLAGQEPIDPTEPPTPTKSELAHARAERLVLERERRTAEATLLYEQAEAQVRREGELGSREHAVLALGGVADPEYLAEAADALGLQDAFGGFGYADWETLLDWFAGHTVREQTQLALLTRFAFERDALIAGEDAPTVRWYLAEIEAVQSPKPQAPSPELACARCGEACPEVDEGADLLANGSRLDPRGHLVTAHGAVYCRECRPRVVFCRECGCTDENCSLCIRRSGSPCRWVESDLCSACAADPLRQIRVGDYLTGRLPGEKMLFHAAVRERLPEGLAVTLLGKESLVPWGSDWAWKAPRQAALTGESAGVAE